MALVQWILASPPDLDVEMGQVRIDGHSMHYLRTGSGPDLLLLHGLLGAASCWRPSLKALAADSTVYALDALGLGESDRVPDLDPGLEASADRIARFMDAVGIAEADFVATSHGGAVALMLAARHPERVRSLVLQAPANPYSNLTDGLIRFYKTPLGEWFARRLTTFPRRLQLMALGRMYGQAAQVRDGSLNDYLRSIAVPGTVDYVLRILGGWRQDMKRLEEALPQIQAIPILLLWGADDRAVSLESGHALAKRLIDAHLVILPGVGHLPFEEDPVMFTKAVNRFLVRLDRTTRLSRPRPILLEGNHRSAG